MADRPIRVLELRSVRGTGGGPEKTIFMGAARTDPRRFAVTVCYIRDRRDQVYALDQIAGGLKVDYVEVYERHSFDTGIFAALRQIIRDRQIDIVHAHEYKTDLLALLLARVEQVVPLATAHGWTGHSRREKVLYYPVDRWLLRRYPRVITVSDQIRSRLVAPGRDNPRISTILNGIDHTIFKRQPERVAAARAEFGFAPSDIVIGSVGRLEPQKRFDLLLEAARTLRQTEPRLKLLIAGDGSLKQDLLTLRERLGLSDACVLAGHRKDVIETLHAMDVFVQSSDYEGTPNAVLEAMAVELPIVATTAGGTDQLIEDGVHGLLVAPGDTAALVAAVTRVLDDPDAAARRVRAARSRVEDDLSFDKRMQALERIYVELAGAHRGVARPAAVTV